MKRLCGLFAAAALLVGVSASAASAESSGPLSGLEAICLMQGGVWYPTGFSDFPFPACGSPNVTVWQDVPGSYASNQLVAANRLCIEAGFSGVALYGKGVADEQGPGISVETWACF